MHWNYRIVNLKSENGGEDWYCIREVYYDDNDKPEGHSDVAVGSESLEDVLNVLDMMRKATELPALQESDFEDAHEEWVSEFLRDGNDGGAETKLDILDEFAERAPKDVREAMIRIMDARTVRAKEIVK